MQAFQQNLTSIQQLQASEGLTVIDGQDDFETHTYTFTGLDQMLLQFAQQIAGSFQIPMVRFFAQSPAGMNATGDSDWRNYETGIAREQENKLRHPLGAALRMIYRSEFGKEPPENFSFKFKPLRQVSEVEKAENAGRVTTTVVQAFEAGLVSQQTALQELRQSSEKTGIWSNVTDEIIDAADDEPPAPEEKSESEPGGKRPSSALKPDDFEGKEDI
jgi:uncharacterized protein